MESIENIDMINHRIVIKAINKICGKIIGEQLKEEVKNKLFFIKTELEASCTGICFVSVKVKYKKQYNLTITFKNNKGQIVFKFNLLNNTSTVTIYTNHLGSLFRVHKIYIDEYLGLPMYNYWPAAASILK